MGGNVNSCLYVKKSAQGIVFTAKHVYDNVMIDNIKAINVAIIALKDYGLVLKFVKGPQDYLSCKIKFSHERQRLDWNSLIPKFLVVRSMMEGEKISAEDQWKYWLGVSM